MHYILFICSSVWTFWAIVSNIDVSISVQIPVQVPAFNSFECIPRSGISGSYGNSTFNFFLVNQHTIFHSGCTREQGLREITDFVMTFSL